MLAAAGLALILRFTLVPTGDVDTGAFRTCLLCGELGLSDFIGNVALFMPLAAGLYLAGARGRTTIAWLFVLSASIELAQLWIPGRDSTIGDVLSNTIGAAAGVGVAYWLPRRHRSARAGFTAAAGVLVVVAAIAVAFQPKFPRTTYYGQWTPELGQYELYRGTVLSADIGGMSLPSWRLADSKAVRLRLLQGVSVKVHAVAGPPPPAPAPVFNIYDSLRNEIVFLGADGADLVAHVRLWATDLRLRQPDLRWRGALAGLAAGDTFDLRLRRHRPGFCVAVNSRERCGLGYTVGEAWGLIQLPLHLPSSAGTALDVLFMAGLGLCAGLFVRKSAAGYLAVVAVLGGTALLPVLFGLPPTPLLQLGGLALGVASGLSLP